MGFEENRANVVHQGRPTDVKKSLEDASIPISKNTGLILEGLGIPNLTFEQKINRIIPVLDVSHIGNILLWGGISALTHHIATKGGTDTSLYHGVFDFMRDITPSGVKDILNAVNEAILFLVKGQDYGDGAVLGMMSRISFGWALYKGVIPWRGDQITWKKAHVSEKEIGIKSGTFPYQGENHIVGIGMRDPISFSEVDDRGTSLFKALKGESELVLVQKDGPYWQPSVLRTGANDSKLFVNLKALEQEGVSISENYLPAIISGAYKAKGLVVNCCKEVDLFMDYIIDHEKGEEMSVDLSQVRYLVKHAVELRNIAYKDREKLNISLVIPEYSRQKYVDDNGLEDTVKINFPKNGTDYNLSYISREQVFIDTLIKIIKEKGLTGNKVYIDTEGSNEKAGQRCKDMLLKTGVYKEEDIFTDFQELKGREGDIISILLRNQSDTIGTSSRHARDIRGVSHIFYPQTTRGDTVDHSNNSGEWKRIPVNYNSQIGKQVLESLSP